MRLDRGCDIAARTAWLSPRQAERITVGERIAHADHSCRPEDGGLLPDLMAAAGARRSPRAPVS
jgi:hypothetical protein